MSENDPLGGIELEEPDSYGQKVAEAIPIAGDAVATFNNYRDASEDGDVTTSELRSLAADGGSFVSSCMGAVSDFASDPIGWLVGEGLDFLISICQPLQDLIHMASGDGPALSNAAGSFGNIGQGIADFGDKFAEDAVTALAEWEGEAAQAAATKFAEFAKGIKAVAGEAGNIAELLQISSMIMTVIEEFLKALLTEFITWLIMIWIPALAAAVPTAGASTAAAGTATGVRAAQTGARATKQVSWLRKLLDAVKDLLAKLKSFLSRQGTGFRQAMANKRARAADATEEIRTARAEGTTTSWTTRLHDSQKGMVGERVTDGFGRSVFEALYDTTKEQASKSAMAGHYDDLRTWQEHGSLGEEQEKDRTSEQLDY
ncbi:hypothetical protein [Saccharomonospora saliphila]|uniref:hypothetical protein n=1 Tax=Saccharomonospora saliphila TaxID=369829 RepID=UPI000361DE52|nr:hypothetical protein [Saccharomonospora saliphila]